MKIVPFGAVANDIPAGLRRLADRIEAGDFPDLQFVTALTVTRGGEFIAFAWGQCSTLETLGAHARAVAHDLVNE